MANSKVSVLKTEPKSVVQDYGKLMRMADYKKAISKKYETLLKINLSWSLYYPSCSTEPWQLDGVMKTLIDDVQLQVHYKVYYLISQSNKCYQNIKLELVVLHH